MNRASTMLFIRICQINSFTIWSCAYLKLLRLHKIWSLAKDNDCIYTISSSIFKPLISDEIKEMFICAMSYK